MHDRGQRYFGERKNMKLTYAECSKVAGSLIYECLKKRNLSQLMQLKKIKYKVEV